jgi:transposase
MSGKRQKYIAEFGVQADRLVIETGRPIARVATEIGVGDQVRARRVRPAQKAAFVVSEQNR